MYVCKAIATCNHHHTVQVAWVQVEYSCYIVITGYTPTGVLHHYCCVSKAGGPKSYLQQLVIDCSSYNFCSVGTCYFLLSRLFLQRISELEAARGWLFAVAEYVCCFCRPCTGSDTNTHTHTPTHTHAPSHIHQRTYLPIIRLLAYKL